MLFKHKIQFFFHFYFPFTLISALFNPTKIFASLFVIICKSNKYSFNSSEVNPNSYIKIQ